MGILEAIKTILPSKYRIFLTDVPAEGECLVISESSIQSSSSDLDKSDKTITSYLHFYVRCKLKSGVYEDTKQDLLDYHSLIEDYWYRELGGNRILSVTDPTVTPSGRDKNGNSLYSMVFQITYSRGVH